ncbi:acs-17 [Pristionchus pacificus]|uniref:long-chain-fatty-acid--CoA ligase n=1 Tax=Pristionchus pacificus TaxID=54126 RepID=A0A2A6D3E8_PRIPA|nr:acs-17 [Pristionchus pacificus]|eukprot:PDM84827.1 acs-17 [Pristionchus pacificus]
MIRMEKVEKEIDEGSGGKPVYITIVLSILKVIFFVYDVIVFLPFQIFANPSEKLARSDRTKARPIVDGDPTSPFRHVDTIDGDLDVEYYKGVDTLAKLWMENVRRYSTNDCLGTREVLQVHKEKQPSGKIFEKWELGVYHFRSYNQVNERVNMAGSALASLGQKEKEHIVIFADTREEWMTTALACFKWNFPIATVYATLGEEAVEFAMNEVGADTIITTAPLLPKVYKAISRGVNIKNIVYFESQDPIEKLNKVQKHSTATVLSFEELLNLGTSDEPTKMTAKANDVAMTMYTSGTTGNPKGVMIAHSNIVAATCGQGKVLAVGTTDTYIGYLPLAHILEVCGEIVCQTKGTRIGYSSAQTLFDRAPKIMKGTKGDCYALKPTLMACVPAVMDRIYKAVIQEVNSGSLLFREMFLACYERKRSRYEDGYQSMVLNKLVFNKIGKMLGGKIRIILSGGAPLSAETQRFMNICFCCPVVQGYGLTETCGGGTIADGDDLSTGSVGPPLRCAEILLREWPEAGYSPHNEVPQGEILIGGGQVALGYYKNEEKTKEDFVTVNGKRYFATGDIGEFRPDGSLKIIDRKKDLLKLAHGEYISLGKVETTLLTCPLVENICVYGDSQSDFLVALVVPNQKNVMEIAEKLGAATSKWESVCSNKDVNKAVLAELVSYIGSKLQRVEVPAKIHLCHDVWTPQSGLLTEALKLKRKAIETEFKKQLNAMYGKK